GAIDRIKINFDILTILVSTVNLITSAWLFEFSNFVSLTLHTLLKIADLHPLFFWLIGTVFLGVSHSTGHCNGQNYDELFHFCLLFEQTGVFLFLPTITGVNEI